MSLALTSSADRFSVNGLIFRDYINLKNVITISLCKDRYYSHFDILFFFGLGTRSGSYTDEQILRVGHFPITELEKAENLIVRMLSEKETIFDIDKELGKERTVQTTVNSQATATPPTSPAISQTATEDTKTQGTA